MPDPSPDAAGGRDVLVRVAHYALLSGLCQLIPLPFIDDAADRQVRKRLVGSVLARRGRTFDPDHVRPLYAGPTRGLAGRAASFGKSLVLKPIRKLFRTVFFFIAIRRAILETGEALLLGHTLDRLLADGWLADGASRDELARQAEAIQQAVGATVASPERRGLMQLVRATVRRHRPSRSDADASPPAATEPEAALTDAGRERLDRAADDLAGRLDSAEGRSMLDRLDASIDRHLAASTSRQTN